jgi:MoxR-like ATPase
MTNVQDFSDKLITNIEKVIIGKRDTLELSVITLLCQGHLLIEDVPGVGKTMLARSIARSIGCTFSRIQFTPDMLPSDVTGVSIYNQANREFEFRSGPIMAQIVLTDEINRATPKTQAALLEAMEERQVTVDGVTHFLPKPFMVMATQNPIEYEGTFPLPEAQLDRFLLRVKLGYPGSMNEIKVLERQQFQHPIESLGKVITEEEVLEAQEEVKKVFVAPEMKSYMVEITRRTRDFPDVYLGASPRGSLTLFRTSQSRAAIFGREFVLPDDVKALAESALCHRIILGPAARLRDMDAAEVIDEILNSVPVPGGDLSKDA